MVRVIESLISWNLLSSRKRNIIKKIACDNATQNGEFA